MPNSGGEPPYTSYPLAPTIQPPGQSPPYLDPTNPYSVNASAPAAPGYSPIGAAPAYYAPENPSAPYMPPGANAAFPPTSTGPTYQPAGYDNYGASVPPPPPPPGVTNGGASYGWAPDMPSAPPPSYDDIARPQ